MSDLLIASAPPTRAERILLVDDTPTSLQVLFQTLDGRGYEILVATTGEDALTVAREATFEEQVVAVGPGDRVYLYSDGAFEEMNAAREMFGSRRLHAMLASDRATSLAATLDSVIDAIGAFTGVCSFTDDISLVAAEITA